MSSHHESERSNIGAVVMPGGVERVAEASYGLFSFLAIFGIPLLVLIGSGFLPVPQAETGALKPGSGGHGDAHGH